MVNYNLTNLTSATHVSDVVKVANEFTEGVLVLAFLLGFFFIVVMVLKRGLPLVDSLAVAGFTSFVISLFMSYAGLLNVLFTLVFLAIAAFAGILMYMRQS